MGDIDHFVGPLPLGGEYISTGLILNLPMDEVAYDQCSFLYLPIVVASEALLESEHDGETLRSCLCYPLIASPGRRPSSC